LIPYLGPEFIEAILKHESTAAVDVVQQEILPDKRQLKKENL
jgi:hypothetical protein